MWDYILLGIVQGVSEWLPVSSSGHLVLFERWLSVEESLSFDVFLHLGSLLVIFIFFHRDILQFFKIFLDRAGAEDKSLWFNVAASTTVTVPVALLLEPYLSAFRQNIKLVAGAFLVTTFFLWLSRKREGSRDVFLSSALILGAVQGLAVLPGLSRSGITIAVALLLGISRRTAFRFSFLMAMPAIFGAFLWQLKEMHFSPEQLLGFAVSMIISYLSLVLLRIIVNKKLLHWFAFYTLILSLFILVL